MLTQHDKALIVHALNVLKDVADGYDLDTLKRHGIIKSEPGSVEADYELSDKIQEIKGKLND